MRGHQNKEGVLGRKSWFFEGDVAHRMLEPEVEEVMLSPGTAREL